MARTLVIQMGHCFRRTGATGTTGEQEYATAVADACRELLHGKGDWVVRAILADDTLDRYRGDAFFAVHCDGSENATARGASVGYRNTAGQALGQAFKRAYEARGWKGFRPDNYTAALRDYYGTRHAVSQGNSKAVIIECGFLTNADDRAALTAQGGPQRVALAIGDALGIPHEEDDMPGLKELLDTPVGTDGNNALQSYRTKPGTFGHWLLGQRQFLEGAARTMTAMAAQLTRMELEQKAMRAELSDDERDILAALQADDDPAAVAAHLAPLLLAGGGMARLSDEDVQAVADASADEADRRERTRLGTQEG